MVRPDDDPAARPDREPTDDRPSRHPHQRGREPADPALVEMVRQIAGDGDLDDRCRRILAVFAPYWGLDPMKD